VGLSTQEFDIVLADAATYQQLISQIYDAIARKSGKRFAGEKTPDYVRRFRLLHGLFPSAKLIHIIRDGRDVALSLLDWSRADKGPGRFELWKQHPVAVCALWWRWMVLTCNADRQHIDPELYHLVRYETLVNHPDQSLRQISDFLGLEYHQQMAEFNCGREKLGTQLSAKSAWLSPQRRIRDWREDMLAQHIELFEALAGDALQFYGYALETDSAPPEIHALAEQCRDWWRDNFTKDKTLATFDQSVLNSANPVSSTVRRWLPEL